MTSTADAIASSRLADAAGVLHPLVVHFPIALLVVAVLFELFRRRRDDRPSDAALALLALATLASGVAVVGGWAAADAGGRPASAVDGHRWFGLVTAIAAAAALLLGFLAKLSPWWPGFAAYRGMLLVAALLVAVAGHLGAALVHGPDLLSGAFAALRGRETATDPSNASAVLASADRPSSADADPAQLRFSRDVRPILSRRCFSCHSGDDASAALDLDDRENLLRGGESGTPAVVPGQAAASRLLKAVDGSDPDLRMPPKGPPLSTEEVALIRAWIDQGAATEANSDAHWHWSYRPPTRPTPPPVHAQSWPRNEIDRFVLATLEREGLSPAPEADRATLIRRVSLDLIGLPPSVEEIAAFEQDLRPDAYERVIDRLLASPHYGEHWARLWLDLGRYADTHGYEKDARRTAWPWRDWLIEAFNDDLPYDQFSTAMLAGDLLPRRTLEQVVATGFNRNTQLNEEGGTDPEEFRDDAVIDRTNTFATVWLGSTIACAQCHDHKYDPFSQEEYYSLYAIFNQDDPDVVAGLTETRAAGGMAPWGAPSQRKEIARVWSERESLRAKLDAGAAIRARQAAWEQSTLALLAAAPRPRWTPIVPGAIHGPERVEFIVTPSGEVAVAGASPESAAYVLETTVDLPALAAIRLDLLLPPSPYEQAVGRGGGNVVLTDFRVEAIAGAGTDDARAVPLLVEHAVADYEQPAGSDPAPWLASAALDADPKSGWAVGPRRTRSHSAWFMLDPAMALEPPTTLRITLGQRWGSHHTVARFRLWATAQVPPTTLQPFGPEVEDAFATPAAARTPALQRALDEHFRDLDPEAAVLRESIAALDAQLKGVSTATAMVMQRNAVPRETRLHQRGSFRTPGAVVSPGVPAVLDPAASDRAASDRAASKSVASRLELAEWLFRAENPLVARVAVNRLWERLFGRGLVATSDDFGTQGEPPSHSELLDWLATEYPRLGWRQKSMLRALVTSATYRQASSLLGDGAAQAIAKDPENYLLARASRVRLEAETVRDVALGASGLLSPALGGPSVFPPQPPGVWTMIYSNDQWKESTGPDRYRRGLYTFARRTAPYPTFAAFDAPSREISCTRRSRTNTPLQALATLNDPQFVEAAVALARRMHARGGDVRSQISFGFQLCTARVPSPEELDCLEALRAEELAALRLDPATAAARLSPFPGATPDEAAVDVAALAAVASVLLNLDETLTRG